MYHNSSPQRREARYYPTHYTPTQTHRNYDLSNTAMDDTIKKLLVYPKLPEIVGSIKDSMITAVCADQGFGKTVGIPNALSISTFVPGGIFCAVPSNTAVFTAYNFQSFICRTFNNNHVGYACEGNINYDYHTKIVYCTPDHLLNRIIKTAFNIKKGYYRRYNPWFCSILILDDFHLRKKELDICLCVWLYCYHAWKENPALPRPPRLVIFSVNQSINILPPQTVKLNYTMDRTEPIIKFDDISATYSIYTDERYVRAANLAHQYHQQGHPGTYVIFVPGKQEIDIVTSVLNKRFGSNQAILLYAHDNLNSEEVLKLYDPTATNITKRKIIIATSVAEQLTFHNVTLVLDTLTHREMFYGYDESLRTDLRWISKDNSIRRRNLLNNNKNLNTCDDGGIYIALQSQENYESITQDLVPEVDRLSISYDFLKLVNLELDPISILTPTIISEPQAQMNMTLLKKLGFIRETPTQQKPNMDSNIVSDMWDFCIQFPFSIRKAAMLYHLRQMDDPNIFLHAAVICTLNFYGTGIFVWPVREPSEDVMSYSMKCNDTLKRLEIRYSGYSDIDTIFNIWIDICSKINPFYITDLYAYCSDNELNFRKLRDAAILLKECVLIGNYKTISLNAYHNVKTFVPPNRRILSATFYQLLTLTHSDYETTIIHSKYGELMAICSGLNHKIDDRSVHQMNAGNNGKKVYYTLVRTQKKTKRNTLRIINVLHTLDDAEEDDNFSIFSSSIDSDRSGSQIFSSPSHQ